MSVDLPEPEGPQMTTTSAFFDGGGTVLKNLEISVPFTDVLDPDHLLNILCACAFA